MCQTAATARTGFLGSFALAGAAGFAGGKSAAVGVGFEDVGAEGTRSTIGDQASVDSLSPSTAANSPLISSVAQELTSYDTILARTG